MVAGAAMATAARREKRAMTTFILLVLKDIGVGQRQRNEFDER